MTAGPPQERPAGPEAARGAVEAEKRALRAEMRRRLAALPPGERERGSAAIARRLLAHPDVRRAAAILLYRSLPAEVDTEPIFAAALAAGQTVWFPRLEPGGGLRFERATAETAWRARPGSPVLEPADGEPLRELAPGGAVVVVPGLAFAPDGARLGRAGGAYDRVLASPLLAGVRPRIALAFELQIVTTVPVLPHDVPVDVVVTERRTLERPGRAPPPAAAGHGPGAG